MERLCHPAYRTVCVPVQSKFSKRSGTHAALCTGRFRRHDRHDRLQFHRVHCYVLCSRRPVLHQTPMCQGIWRLSLVMMLENHLDWRSNDHGLLRIAE